jgi:hypothetical protein
MGGDGGLTSFAAFRTLKRPLSQREVLRRDRS